ncbi:MAG: selenium cofactor biosynthesis protein YqeC, partial [Anaerolineae bacterium]|nr:selenium cofactor biosynthesis protein YqeC [Anaerolineae bacterium]
MQLAHALRIAPGDVVAFVGGGGKTSAMFHLAQKVSLEGKKVLITTSTRIFAAQIRLAPAHVTFDPTRQSISDLLSRLQAALDRYGQVLLIGQADPDSGKAFGIAPEVVDALAQTNRFDLILNEADGSRMRPFKAPAGHEPVIPTSTTLVVPVVGLDIWGQPLNDDHVHRAEVVSRLSGVGLNQPVTPQVIATVLTHPQGGIKNAPRQARVIPLLNKSETPEREQAADQIIDLVLQSDRIEAVAIGSIHRPADPISRVV